ncbi:unnamed protein product [Didymodactylos carnosus]|uniref:Uncharacterized protein n=1 Tax=Didymodactylos carnosus TaxID=1234261 RepID=A0A815QPQ9_9BILA|nr:unnamed protein product [Didymodactylos carnosus]CAF1570023.1 unnamed protein product [Didymodactylos carnosus]CAF4335404.1 unnamed protein product [Didymodactylos carnosus]CAF4364241.1 unnamed protein product [Didymodactylos carnosus]
MVLILGKVYENNSEFIWKIQGRIPIPSSANLTDYSSISFHTRGHLPLYVAITSQENSRLWIGIMDTELKLTSGKMNSFPQSDYQCSIKYCNVEGIAWKSKQQLYAVSDKMKSNGLQSSLCWEKDQNIHLFQLPK